MALTVLDRLEPTGNPEFEVVRVQSTSNGDTYISQHFYMIKSFMIQNHGATFATGIKDAPKVTLTQGTATSPALLTINHSASTEIFSIIIIGER